jgi:hypothetical protein
MIVVLSQFRAADELGRLDEMFQDDHRRGRPPG